MRIPGVTFQQGRNSYSDADGRHYGIAIHNTSNTASAASEASYATRRTDGVSSHFYVDGGTVVQSLDTDADAGHAGSSQGNGNAIAVEITGTNDRSREWWLANVAWDAFGAALAYLIAHDPDFKGFQVRRASVAEMRSNPKVQAFYSHDDMRQAWGGTTHNDPGPNFPWDRLLGTVNQHLSPTPTGEDYSMGKLFVITDSPRGAGAVHEGAGGTYRYLTPEMLTAGARAGSFKWPDTLLSYTTAQAKLAFGEDVSTLKGPQGVKGDPGLQGLRGEPGKDGVLASHTHNVPLGDVESGAAQAS